MKKWISLCMAVALAFSLAACSSTDTSPADSSGDMADAGSSSSDAAEPTPEPTADNAVLRDMSAEIANPNLAGKYTANIGGPITEQGDWIYYIAGQSIYRVRKDTMDFAAAELLYQESEAGPIDNLNISGKYMYYLASNRNDVGDIIRQIDLETGEVTTLSTNNRSCSTLFYYDGYLYVSGVEDGIGGAPKTTFVRRMAAPVQDTTLPEQLFTQNFKSYSDLFYILGVNGQDVYLFSESGGIMYIGDGEITKVALSRFPIEAVMAGDTIYLRTGSFGSVIYTLSLMDGSDQPILETEWGEYTLLGVTTDKRPIIFDGTYVLYADTQEIIAEREIKGICTVSNGGIFFYSQKHDDDALYYMDQNGDNFTVVG